MINETVKTVLLNAGWYQGRNVSSLVSKWEMYLESTENWKMFDTVKSILREFGGLKIKPITNGVDYYPEGFEINPCLAEGERDRFEVYEKEICTSLYPIGEMESGMAFLAVGENGKLYYVMTYVKKIGDDYMSGIENLILGKNVIE